MSRIESDTQATAGRDEARRLHAAVSALRADVENRAARLLTEWSLPPGDGVFFDCMSNLAAWLALRQIDLGPLQAPLAALGLSSLGRCEAHVLASIDAVLATLAILADVPGHRHPPARTLTAAKALLAERRDALFGAARLDSPSTRVMVTLPSEAADDPFLVEEIVAAGADCLRINTAHDSPEAWARMAANIRAAATAAGRRVPLMMDLAGPKLRILAVSSREKIRLHPGDRFALAADLPAGIRGRTQPLTATLSHPQILDRLAPGDTVWIDDGVLRARVLARNGTRVELEVTQARAKGGRLKPDKGVNLPGRSLDLPALTAADRDHLGTVLDLADIVGFSFVQTVGDVRDLIAALTEAAGDRPLPAVVLKIETPLAVANLPWLIVAAGARLPVAVMIARGDLAVEIGLDRLSEVQEEILWLCEAARVPVVWATQVLEGLLKEGVASRAEATDAAMAQRADCVMLNKGPHVIEGLHFLRDVLRRMDRHQHKKTARMGRLNAWTPHDPATPDPEREPADRP
ncbi:pyruvate kinase [Rhodovulum sp.]|uniref:pyruvate kinase n=1 Tax=Rhodovulum sp. TaxID=34009 RepID=UPI00185D254A|nr:pyruvate kinase [Rhodovulum sp.]HDR27460.1 pyruvate kinase [Rhodovulum sp.]